MSIERGFTVEGLLVTYLSRNPGTNADNIQQRARFCGYKSKDHLKLSRLWLDEGNLNFYIKPTEPAVKPIMRKNENSDKSLGKEFTISFS